MNSRTARVLVVDDDVTVRVLMRTALRKVGLDVVLAATGTEGLARFAEQDHDLVLLDVDMPDLNGLDLCRRLRAQVGDALPIVMVTGMDDVDSVERAYEAGATDFFAKPIHWTLLGHRVQYLLRSSRAVIELRAMYARNDALLDAIPDSMLRIGNDGLVRDVRAAHGSASGGLPIAAGRLLQAQLPDGIGERLVGCLHEAFASGRVQDLDFALTDPLLGSRHYESRIARIDNGEALCLVRDITERAEAERALLRSERRLEQAQSLARLGNWHVHLASKAVEWSTQTYRIFGVPQGEPVTFDLFFSLLHPEDAPVLHATWDRCIRTAQPYTVEYRALVGERVVWISETGEIEADARGRAVAAYGTVQDITERKEAENRIARLAFVDSLTGLPNRPAFLDRLEREVSRAAGDGRRLALLFMDLDGFKAINDTLGHDTGDELLRSAADRLRQVLRPSDMVSRPQATSDDSQLARLGGDEFTALLIDVREPEDAMGAAQRVLDALRRPFRLDGRDLALSASIGIAMFPDDGQDAASLLKHADTAMYHAKEHGRDNYQFYSAALTQRALERMTLDRDLRAAIEAGQFHLVYQPQCDARSGEVVGVEALLRWNHPQRGPVSPMDFIPLAESNGLIVPIGRWVLQEACRTLAAWQREGTALRVAVNLSPVQLRDPDLVSDILELLARTGLKPNQLELEVTEGTLMDDGAATQGVLQALHDAGIRLALDDFGTGYSSMSYLKRMPVRTLKIDQSFVSGLPDDRDSDAIVRAIVSMAGSLGFDVTAEGVETAAQAELLRGIGCDALQGYHIGRPMKARDIAELLRAADHDTGATPRVASSTIEA